MTVIKAAELFRARSRDYTTMIVTDDNVGELVEGLQRFPKNSALWLKAYEYFKPKSPEAGYNVIGRAFTNTPDHRIIAEIMAEESIAMGIAAKEAHEPREAMKYFHNAETIYFDLTYAFDWQDMMRPLAALYDAWEHAEGADLCERAQSEPFDVAAINTLIRKRQMANIEVTRVAIADRLTRMPNLQGMISAPS